MSANLSSQARDSIEGSKLRQYEQRILRSSQNQNELRQSNNSGQLKEVNKI